MRDGTLPQPLSKPSLHHETLRPPLFHVIVMAMFYLTERKQLLKIVIITHPPILHIVLDG